MAKTKFDSVSFITFFLVVIICSFVYILYDFLNNDVREVTSLYGWVQFAMVSASIFIYILNIKINQKFLSSIFYSLLTMLLCIQTVPAFFWFWFDGQIVNDKPYDGITGNWIFGAYHLFIVVWGIFNIVKTYQAGKSTS